MRSFPYPTVLAAAIAGVALLAMVLALRDNERLKEENMREKALVAEVSRKLREADRRVAEAADRETDANKRAAESRMRAASAEASLQSLMQIVQPRATGISSGKAGDYTISIDPRQRASAAQARAQVLIGQRKWEEALAEYLAAYREVRTRRRGGVESQAIANALQRLAQTHPPAKDVLQMLRDTAWEDYQSALRQGGTAALAGNPDATGMLTEIAILNQRLNDDRLTVELHDALPPLDPLRQPLRAIAFLQFVEMRRYEDALLGRPFEAMITELEEVQRTTANPRVATVAARASYLPTAARHIEVLTGAGRSHEARVLTEKLIVFDNSEATKTLVQRHVERAGLPRSQPAAP
jgi:hypothetical protein